MNCTLCQTPVRGRSFLSKEDIFCCAGCQAVHQILQLKGELSDYQNSPLFKQALRAGLISNPELLEEIQRSKESLVEEEIHKLYLEIEEMWCPSCAMVIKLVLLQEKGVKECSVDYATDLASISFSPKIISKEKIIKIIEKLGYRPRSLKDPRENTVSSSLNLRFIIAAFFSLNIMMFAYPIYASFFHDDMGSYPELFGWLSFIGSIPVLVYSAWPIWRRFVTALRVGIWGMETLVFIGVVSATGLSIYELLKGSPYIYFDSMTVIIVFVLLGKIVETKAKFSAKDSLVELVRALPRKGRKQFSDGEEKFVPIKEVNSDDKIIVLTGEKIVIDGIIEKGEGAVDESLMTGESLPVYKKAGDRVLAGTILQNGNMIIRVGAVIDETALHRIIEMVEQEIGHKTQYVRPVDKIVRVFVPIVVFLAIATASYCLIFAIQDGSQTVLQTAIIRAVSVLLISCPCAIGIAAPLAESYVLNALAKKGAIVRNRACLSLLGKETVFVFDKTGTITEGKFTVLQGIDHLSFGEQRMLKSLVSKSIHPVASAIHQSLLCISSQLEEIQEVVGKGIVASFEGKRVMLGSEIFLREAGIHLPDRSATTQIETNVYFAVDGICLTSIVLGDKIRPDAIELVASLGRIKKMLVSGDSSDTVQRVAAECRFDEWHAECHPLKKRELVDTLKRKGEIVAVMGDGINDAPALTSAHISIAVVSASDISIQVSDLLLTTDRLLTVSALHKIAIKGRQIIKQNLFWAFFYNCVGIGLAMAGFMTPLFAAFAMIVSSLVVLFNARRITYDPFITRQSIQP